VFLSSFDEDQVSQYIRKAADLIISV